MSSRLGLQVAAGLLDGSGDGVWLVELAAVTDQDAVAPAIAGTLGIAGQPGRPVAEALLDALAPQDILIVLDNCEHLIDACAKIADAIVRHCPRLHLLATSREPLGIGGETSYDVSVKLNLGWVLRQEADPDGARSMFEASLRTSRRNGDRAATAYASLGLACLAEDLGDWRQAGQLHGVAQALLDRTGKPWEDPEARYREASLDNVRARLGDEQWGRAYAEGTALSLDEALDLARGTVPPGLTPFGPDIRPS